MQPSQEGPELLPLESKEANNFDRRTRTGFSQHEGVLAVASTSRSTLSESGLPFLFLPVVILDPVMMRNIVV
jgi:hypothetical protein